MGGTIVTILRLRRLPSLDVLIQMLGRRPTTSPCRLPDARLRRDEPLRPTFRFPFITLPSPRLLSFFLVLGTDLHLIRLLREVCFIGDGVLMGQTLRKTILIHSTACIWRF